MKNRFSLIPRLLAGAVAAASLSCAGLAYSQGENTTYAPDPADRAGQETELAPGQQSPQEKAFNTMAGVGAKPSKAELAKQKEAGQVPSQAAQRSGAVSLSTDDRAFITTAAKDGMKEVEMAKMAVQQGQSDDVKKLGQKIAADHTKANNQLMGLAQKKGVKLDTRFKMEKMSKKDMENFDQAWLTMMMRDHEQDINLYEMQAKNGTDPELKAWAKKTVPVLKSHLKAVKSAQSKMAKAGS